jgi:hypothetical protein
MISGDDSGNEFGGEGLGAQRFSAAVKALSWVRL